MDDYSSMFRIGSPELTEKLAAIRQGASQAQGGGLLQSLLAEVMKTSPRGAAVGGGSRGVMLPTPAISTSMPPAARVPTKDKTAAARKYKKQQHDALKRGLSKFEKGQRAEDRYKILVFEGVDQAIAKGAVGKMYQGDVVAAEIAQEERGLKTKIAEEKRAETRKLKAAGKLATAKVTAAGDVAIAKTDRETRDRIYDMSKSIATYVDEDTKKEFVDDEQANKIASDALKLMEEGDLDEGIAMNRAAFNVKGDDLKFNPGQTKWFDPDNFEDTVDFAKQAHQDGITTKEISDKLVSSGRPLKEGEDSVETVLEASGLSPSVGETVYSNIEEIKRDVNMNKITEEQGILEVRKLGGL